MKPVFIWYPKCSNCQKVAKWLEANHITFETRDIVINNPTFEELSVWVTRSGLPITRFFNTSGILYRELNLKDKVKTLNLDDALKILASDGMLVKRPVLVLENQVLVGFREEEWRKALNL